MKDKNGKMLKVVLYFYRRPSESNKELNFYHGGRVALPTNLRYEIKGGDDDSTIPFGTSQGTWEDAVKQLLKQNNIKVVEE